MERISITLEEEFILFLHRNHCLESYFEHHLSFAERDEFNNILESQNPDEWIEHIFRELGYLPTYWKNLNEDWNKYLTLHKTGELI